MQSKGIIRDAKQLTNLQMIQKPLDYSVVLCRLLKTMAQVSQKRLWFNHNYYSSKIHYLTLITFIN